MAQMRIAGEIINIPDKAPEPKPKRGRAKKTTADAPASDQASPQSDHVFFELGVLFVKLLPSDVIACQAEFNTVETGINMAYTSV